MPSLTQKQVIRPRKNPLFTAQKLARLAKGDPRNLPILVVYDDDKWTTKPMVDSKFRIHMNKRQALYIRENFDMKPGIWLSECGRIWHIKVSEARLDRLARGINIDSKQTVLDDKQPIEGLGRNMNNRNRKKNVY